MDDVKLDPFFGPTIYLNGTLTQNPDGTVTQRARANDIDFTFYYIPKERYIELKGEMQDRRGEDRALQVIFNVPVNLPGRNWNLYLNICSITFHSFVPLSLKTLEFISSASNGHKNLANA